MSEIKINTLNLKEQIEQLEALRQLFDSEQAVLPELSGEGSAARGALEWGNSITELSSCMNILLDETAAFLRNAGVSFSETDARISSRYEGHG